MSYKHNIDTKILHSEVMPLMKGSANPPVHHTSTILFDTLKEFKDSEKLHNERGQSSYGIYGNTVSYTLEEIITDLEEGAGTVLVPSGLAAITMTLNALVEKGDHILIADSVYEPTRMYCEQYLNKNGVEVDFFPPEIDGDIVEFIQPNTKLVFLESPGSMTFELHDIPEITKVTKEKGILTAIDNTWASSYYLKPLNLGVDVSIQAVTKYISGHSDLIMGCITANKKAIKQIKKYARLFGNYVGSDDVYLSLRGIRTLAPRMKLHNDNSIIVAKWLENKRDNGFNMIDQVIHPALPSYHRHNIWKRDFTGAGGLFAFTVNETNFEKLAYMHDHLRLFGKGFSWGGYNSLLVPGGLQGNRQFTPNYELKGKTLLRIYIGLEEVDDLIDELDAALNRLTEEIT